MSRRYAQSDVEVKTQVVPIGPDGGLTLPPEMLRGLGIEEGGVLTVFQLGNWFIAVAGESVVQREGEAIQRLMKEKGITLEEMLEGLEEQRERIYRERYGGDAT